MDRRPSGAPTFTSPQLRTLTSRPRDRLPLNFLSFIPPTLRTSPSGTRTTKTPYSDASPIRPQRLKAGLGGVRRELEARLKGRRESSSVKKGGDWRRVRLRTPTSLPTPPSTTPFPGPDVATRGLQPFFLSGYQKRSSGYDSGVEEGLPGACLLGWEGMARE